MNTLFSSRRCQSHVSWLLLRGEGANGLFTNEEDVNKSRSTEDEVLTGPPVTFWEQ